MGVGEERGRSCWSWDLGHLNSIFLLWNCGWTKDVYARRTTDIGASISYRIPYSLRLRWAKTEHWQTKRCYWYQLRPARALATHVRCQTLRNTELQIRRGNNDNSKISSYFSTKTYVVTLFRTIWQDGFNEGSQRMFLLENWKNIPKLSLLPLLIWGAG